MLSSIGVDGGVFVSHNWGQDEARLKQKLFKSQ